MILAEPRNRSDEAAIDAGCYFDAAAADRVRYFFARFLRHSKGEFANRPFELLDWQWQRIVAPLFGWKMPDGSRRFRRAAIAIPKKNGKSTLLSGIGLYMLVGDGEPGAEVYSAAADRAQASIIYNEAANMVDASALAGLVQVKRGTKELYFPRGKALYKALSADVKTKEGLNWSCLLFDELHAQLHADLWNTLRYGGAARRQPLLLWISTAGMDRDSLGYQQWQRAKAVQESREIDINLLPYIVETAEDADWTDEKVWRAANPSYGITINERAFREDFESAKANPAEENSFRRYRLNQWTRQVTRWIARDKWDTCAAVFTQDSQKRQRCKIGIDLATTTDLCTAVALFREGLKYRALPYFWLPEGALRAREKANKTRLDEWVRLGLIKLTPGDVLDYNTVREDINAIGDIFKVDELCIDPWNATQIATDLEGDGFNVTYVRTGFISISAAAKEFEKLVLGGGIEHPSHPVLDWCFGNVAIEQDASGNIKPSKRKSTEKIDGIVALILALARYIVQKPKRKSKYETRGIQTL